VEDFQSNLFLAPHQDAGAQAIRLNQIFHELNLIAAQLQEEPWKAASASSLNCRAHRDRFGGADRNWRDDFCTLLRCGRDRARRTIFRLYPES
jgi:hypothetical protein